MSVSSVSVSVPTAASGRKIRSAQRGPHCPTATGWEAVEGTDPCRTAEGAEGARRGLSMRLLVGNDEIVGERSRQRVQFVGHLQRAVDALVGVDVIELREAPELFD